MLKYWPAHYKSWVNMANLLPALGRYDEAVTASWEGIQLAPDMCASRALPSGLCEYSEHPGEYCRVACVSTQSTQGSTAEWPV